MTQKTSDVLIFASLLATAATVAGCTAAPPPEPAHAESVAAPAERAAERPVATSNDETLEDGTCDLVCGNTSVVAHGQSPEETADQYTTQAAEQADRVLDGMRGELLACYVARVKEVPTAHAFLTVDIVVGPDGHVQKVETQGGALLGDKALACIVDQIESREFSPPRGGGTMRLRMPLTFRRVAEGEDV
jgi:hypothetical protein